MRTNKGHLCGVCYCKRISHHHLSLVDSKAGGGVVKQYSEKQEGFRPGGSWGGGLTGSGASYVISLGNTVCFLCLVLIWVWGQNWRSWQASTKP